MSPLDTPLRAPSETSIDHRTRRATVGVALAATTVAAACTTYSTSPSAVPPGARPLAAADIRETFARPVTQKDAAPGNDGFRHEVRPDGRWTVRTGLLVNPTGTWRIDGDRLCLSLLRSEDCATVYRIDTDRPYVSFEGGSLEHSTLRVERRPERSAIVAPESGRDDAPAARPVRSPLAGDAPNR